MKAAYLLAAILIALASIARAQVASIPLQRFQPCLAIEDMTKDRLNCYDEIVPPEPKASPSRAQLVVECRFLKEEDARIMCFNRFVAERAVVGGGSSPPVAAPRTVVVRSVKQINISPEQFRACLAIEDKTKRLTCYDAIVKPEFMVVTSPAKNLGECRFLRTEERLACFNRFLAPSVTHLLPAATLPTATTRYVKHGRGGCGSRGGAGYRTKSGRCASRKR